jgi:hypothetical protein
VRFSGLRVWEGPRQLAGGAVVCRIVSKEASSAPLENHWRKWSAEDVMEV